MERGPELVNLAKGAAVYTASETRKMIPGFAGGTSGATYKTVSQIYAEKINKGSSSSSSKSTASSKAAKAAAAAAEKAAKKAEAARKKIEKENEKIRKEIQKQKDGVSNSVASFVKSLHGQAESLLDFGNLFEQVVMKKMSGEKLRKNLKSQIDYMKQWQSSLLKIGKRIGTSSALYQNLLARGPEAAAEIGALGQLSGEKLTDYVKMFEQKRDISYEMGYKMEASQNAAELKSNQIVFNITGNKISDELDVDIIANKMIQKLKVAGVY